MTYIRPTNPTPIAPQDKQRFIIEYLEYYKKKALEAVEQNDFSELNVKLPRSAAEGFLNQVGNLLLDAAKNSLSQEGEIQKFLAENALPENLQERLPDEFRAYCLLLNSLKQWVAAESAATDRWLLGGTVRQKLKSAVESCLVTGKPLGPVELHHPARDGRPPIPLSPAGHKRVETATEGDPDDTTMAALRQLKSAGHRSWKALRDGCLSHLGECTATRNENSLRNAKTFAMNARRATRKNFEQLIEWLDENQLGN